MPELKKEYKTIKDTFLTDINLISKDSDEVSAPWLSILIPVYNVKPYLDDCFQSILSQVDSGVEIIALDDQSTDDSLAHLQLIAAASTHPITVLQHEQNRGLSAARNTLVKHANGDYVWFIDSDDALHKGALASLRKIVRQQAPDLVICDYELWSSDGRDNNIHVKSFGGQAGKLVTNPELLFRGVIPIWKVACVVKNFSP